ncbi:RNA polymerase sigma factor SigJ [Tumebacillus lipolyticus]|uniref:RNA polymerase sigma factor SigJ n=1 Tax=Tumebacillus lipolyticus TaxID=1280370 RepID=A0ABW4ZW47_9BACL
MDHDRSFHDVSVEELYLSLRTYLVSIAYRMLGSLIDAEDVVHDTFMKLQASDISHLNHAKSYLTKMVTNRCIDEIRSVKKKRETYLGTWLPEPLVQGHVVVDPSEKVILDDSLRYALLLLMEELSPRERAVYVLKEAFQFEHTEIASLLHVTEANCRKIFSRAKKKMNALADDYLIPDQLQKEHTARFITALSTGNIQEMTDLLADDVTLVADGGGNVMTAINEIVSKERVATILHAIATKFFAGKTAYAVRVNNQMGILVVKDGEPFGVWSIVWHPTTHQINRLFYVVNPEKLQHVNLLPTC